LKKTLANLSDKPKSFNYTIHDEEDKNNIVALQKQLKALEQTLHLAKRGLETVKTLEQRISQLEYFKAQYLFQCPVKNFDQVDLIRCHTLKRTGKCLKSCHERRQFNVRVFGKIR